VFFIARLGLLILTVSIKLARLLVIGLLFWPPKQRKKRIDRRLRGREEYRALQQAEPPETVTFRLNGLRTALAGIKAA
jgi:hypothetical protein